MKQFTTIAIEINSMCNRNCIFCPNNENTRPYEIMSLRLITKILKQLSTYHGRIEFYMYNEPMLDDRLEYIIKLCRELVPRSCIMIATNGDKVTDTKDFRELFTAGLNQLQINVYSEDRYKFLKDIIEKLWWVEEGNIYSRTSKQVYALEKKWDISDGKLGRFKISNRSGNISLFPRLKEPLKSICVRPFRSMQINWKGEAVLCCNDYFADVIVGDVDLQTIKTIWNGCWLHQYRRALQNKNRNMELCRYCNFNGGAYKHLLEKA